MLKIAKSIEYAILAIRYFDMNSEKVCISSKEISKSVNIPLELNAKILQKLSKKGIIESQQGTKGGYRLMANTSELTISDIIVALGENIQMTDCLFDTATTADCQRMENCCLRSPLGIVQDKINNVLSSTTLSEFL